MPSFWSSFYSLSFITSSSKRCPPSDLPDYYRTTRQEHYAPNMLYSSRIEYQNKVIDIRRKASFEDSCSLLLPDLLNYDLEISPSEETLKSEGTRKNKKINAKCKTVLLSAKTSFYSLKQNISKRKIHFVTRASDDFELDLSN